MSRSSRPQPAANRASEALASCRSAFVAVALFSAVVNVLMLTGSVYMLQVYDRVLPSRSLPTLVALSLIVVALYMLLGVFDWLRQRILSRIGVSLDQSLSRHVLTAIMRAPLRGAPQDGAQLSRDLDSVRSFLSGLGPTALFDLPWMPFYVAICFLLHPYLGLTLLAGGLLLIILTVLTELLTRNPSAEASRTAASRASVLELARRNAEVAAALGMQQRIAGRFDLANARHSAVNLVSTDIASGLGTISKVIRFILQSALLGVGAWLVINNEASAGVMIASSVLSSRALAPIELAIANWRPFLSARQAWSRLKTALPSDDTSHTVSPDTPRRELTLDQVYVGVPGGRTAIIQNASFRLEAGDALAIIGPSASGKSTLARALAGIWPVARGELRLDGATLDQWSHEARGAQIGYLPQDIQLFDGTVAESIARFDPDMKQEAVIAAAKAAGAYEMILGLPNGFETQIGEAGGALSGGQKQRLGLARALYGDPFFVVLDEPNSNLDAEGDAALASAIAGIRQRKGIVVIIAHRPSALAGVDLVLTLANGQVQAFGAKEEVLRKSLATHSPAPTPAPEPIRAARRASNAPRGAEVAG